MMGGAGLLSFAGTFVLAWFTTPAAPSRSEQLESPTAAIQEDSGIPGPGAAVTGAVGPLDHKLKKAMTEKQLKTLVYEIRENIKEYHDRLGELQLREQRLQTTHDTLKQDIEKLENLRIELASMVARLKSEQENLAQQRVEIIQTERANLMSIAAAYDKMEADSASKILASMCTSKGSQGPAKQYGGEGSNMNDAVKILYYMREATKAEVLAELVSIDSKLAAILVQQLKRIVVQK
jgi:septal ring factor EnvC (AmiA/AmiB activator)